MLPKRGLPRKRHPRSSFHRASPGPRSRRAQGSHQKIPAGEFGEPQKHKLPLPLDFRLRQLCELYETLRSKNRGPENQSGWCLPPRVRRRVRATYVKPASHCGRIAAEDPFEFLPCRTSCLTTSSDICLRHPSGRSRSVGCLCRRPLIRRKQRLRDSAAAGILPAPRNRTMHTKDTRPDTW
jgi:hypothetical protein